jgi:hypothetical protein
MVNLGDLHTQYITDEHGKKQCVILPIAEFEELIEDIEDLAVVAERREEPTISQEALVAELKRDGGLRCTHSTPILQDRRIKGIGGGES